MHKQKGVTKANKYEQTSPTKLNQPRRSMNSENQMATGLKNIEIRWLHL